MSSPKINFRLSKYHLARGLQIIKNLEPNYKATGVGRIVKTIYLDYLAKMSIGNQDKVPQYFIDEVEALLYKHKEKIDFEAFNETIEINNFYSDIEEKVKVLKSSVEDFSPPDDWIANLIKEE